MSGIPLQIGPSGMSSSSSCRNVKAPNSSSLLMLSASIPHWWQGKRLPLHTEITPSPSQPRVCRPTELHLQILLQRQNIGFAAVFFSSQTLSHLLWHSQHLCNNLDLLALSRAVFIYWASEMFPLVVLCAAPAWCAKQAGGIAGASSSILTCHCHAEWCWASWDVFTLYAKWRQCCF